MIDIRYECRHFRGTMPCVPHKEYGVECRADCHFLDPTDGNILLIKLGAMGDVIRTTPLLLRLKKEYPHKRIFWLTHYPAVIPNLVDHTLTLSLEDLTYARSIEFDIGINLDKEREACALMEQLNVSEKFGFALKDSMPAPINQMAEHKFRTGISDAYSKSNRHHYLEEIFSICGWEYDNEKYVLPEIDRSPIADGQRHDQLIVGLVTGSGERWTSRRWPKAHWIDLATLLQEREYGVLLLGGRQEDALNREIQKISGANYLGYLPFSQFVALVDTCRVVVSTVTMAMHVAIGLEKPLVLLNNIFNPNEFHFFTDSKIISPERKCDCFYKPECIHKNSCITEVMPEQIITSVEALIKD